MKKIVLFLLMALSINAQEIAKKKLNSEVVNAEASIVIPFGKLADKFDYAQSYGFWFNVGEDHNTMASIGIDFLFLKNPRDVNYQFKDSIYSLDSNKFGLDVGVRVVKTIPTANPSNYFEFDGALGIHWLNYDFPSEDKKKDEDENDSSFLDKTTFRLVVSLSG